MTFMKGPSLLLTDLYQLTMLQAYFQQNMNETAVFEFFVRDMPEERNFFMAAGLEQAIDYLEELCFTPEEIEWLGTTGRFTDGFLASLEDLRFTGDVHAMPEGSIFFPHEPILRVTAPLSQAQFVETRLINLLHFQTLIASKAARMKLAAPDKMLVDFGFRRAHGAEAGLLAARASYIGGFTGTATVQAGQLFGIPIFGTMAHSYVEAHGSEFEAFLHFAAAQPDNVVLLIDTYDTEAAAHKVVQLAPLLGGRGIQIKAVRLDSGDLADLAGKVRKILDAGGLDTVTIFSSGNIDEYSLHHLREKHAPIDGFGIGTRLVTSSDKAYLDCAYKLEEYAGLPRRKRSEGKATWPGRKQVYRYYQADGSMSHDLVTLDTDRGEGQPLLTQIVKTGKRLKKQETLSVMRERAELEINRLPGELRSLQKQKPYLVTISEALRACAASVDARLKNSSSF